MMDTLAKLLHLSCARRFRAKKQPDKCRRCVWRSIPVQPGVRACLFPACVAERQEFEHKDADNSNQV